MIQGKGKCISTSFVTVSRYQLGEFVIRTQFGGLCCADRGTRIERAIPCISGSIFLDRLLTMGERTYLTIGIIYTEKMLSNSHR